MAPHSQFGLITTRAAAVLRLAHQLTGDPDEAVRAAVGALARMPRRLRPASSFDRRVTAELVRATGVSARHAAVVLAFGVGWDAATIGETCRRSRRAVRADVAAALLDLPEAQWRAGYADPRWTLAVPADLPALVAEERTRLRRARLRRAVAIGSASTAIVASAIAVGRVVTAPSGLPPTAHAPGLLPWPARGELATDRQVRAEAIRAWREVAPAPAGEAFFLYAGDVEGTRLVVLQGYFEDVPAIAVVTDGHLARLLRLPAAPPPALAVTYAQRSGDVVTRLLVAPGTSGVAQRSAGDGLGRPRPAFVARPVRSGLSAGWRAGTDGAARSAVRLTTGAGVETFLVRGDEVTPEEVRPTVTLPPRRWTGLPARVAGSTLTDDAVWFGQLCGDAAPTVAPVWAGRVPGFPAPVRALRVLCGGRTAMWFLTGRAPAVTLAGGTQRQWRGRVFVGLVTPPVALGHAYLVAVGSRRVADIASPGARSSGRVVVVRPEHTRGLRVTLTDGTRIIVR